MRCVICSSNDWESVDEFRVKPEGMCICLTCSHVSYPSLWKSKQEIIEHYRKEYRGAPTFQNLCTNTRKIHFHNLFLQDTFKEWKDKNIKPKIFEVGAAYGMALAFLRDVTKGEVIGSELGIANRRNAWHEFNIELKEDFDDQKYDMIMSYKVLEHQVDADKELQRYAKSLNPGGYLYISVPTWFDSMSNFGVQGFDLGYYYDKNHINVWTRKLFETMLWNNGFKIIKKDTKLYDSTYLCQVHEGTVVERKDYESVEDIKKRMGAIKQAFDLFNLNKFDEAIAVYPDYPQAHVSRFEMKRKEYFNKGWDWVKENVIDFGFKHCPNSSDIDVMAVDVAMRFEKYPEAIKYAENGLLGKPENPIFLMTLINIMRELSIKTEDRKAKEHYIKQAIDISKHLLRVSPQHVAEATSTRYLYNASLPMKGEYDCQ